MAPPAKQNDFKYRKPLNWYKFWSKVQHKYFINTHPVANTNISNPAHAFSVVKQHWPNLVTEQNEGLFQRVCNHDRNNRWGLVVCGGARVLVCKNNGLDACVREIVLKISHFVQNSTDLVVRFKDA